MMGIQNTMKALSDPIRREILDMLKAGRLSAGEIGEKFPVSGAAVSKHLSVLKEADLIRDARSGKYIYYELNASVLEEILPLDELQRKQIKPGMTVREVREIKKMLVAMSQQKKPKPEKPPKNERFKDYTRSDLISYIEDLEAQLEGMKELQKNKKKGSAK